MTAPVVVRFEFRFTTVETGLPTTFALGGISEEVAVGIRDGLRTVPSITDVVAVEVLEHREEVALPGAAGGG